MHPSDLLIERMKRQALREEMEREARRRADEEMEDMEELEGGRGLPTAFNDPVSGSTPQEDSQPWR